MTLLTAHVYRPRTLQHPCCKRRRAPSAGEMVFGPGTVQPLLSHCEWGLPRRASAPGISHTWIWITEASGAPRAGPINGPSGRGLPCGENGEEWTRYETTGNRLTCIQLELLGTAFHNSQHDTRFQETPRAADTALLVSVRGLVRSEHASSTSWGSMASSPPRLASGGFAPAGRPLPEEAGRTVL